MNRTASAAGAVLFLLGAAAPLHADDLTFNVVQDTATFTKRDVIAAVPSFVDGRPVVRIRFAPGAAGRFADLTRRNVKKPMQIVVGDRILSTPIVMEAIAGGEVVLSGNFTAEEAAAIAAKLK
jgi:preprotein translocase subunit SecD